MFSNVRGYPRGYEPFHGFTAGKRRPLPIDPFLPKICAMVGSNRVSIVTAPTGTGKTLRIPQALMIAFRRTSVLVTQTRRDAVRWNGSRMAAEWGCAPGDEIGWRLAGCEPVYSHRTLVETVIDQSLVNRILRAGGMLPPGIIVIDEAHDQSGPLAYLFGLLKEGLMRVSDTRLLILSATIDAKAMSDFYFGAPVMEIDAREFEVERQPMLIRKGERRWDAVIRAAHLRIDSFLAGTLDTPGKDGGPRVPVTEGSYLVQWPGKAEVRLGAAAMRARVEALGAQERVEVIEYHSEVDEDIRYEVIRPSTPGVLRVIHATCAARNSITFPDVVGTTDSMRVRRPTADAFEVDQLVTFPVSRAEADQAAGRGGRTRSSFYEPVIFEGEWNILRPYPTPHIQRASMGRTVLDLAAIGRRVSDFPFLDQPDPLKVKLAERRLERLGLLDKEGAITAAGRDAAGRTMTPESALALRKAKELDVLPEAAIALMGVEEDSLFWGARRVRERMLLDKEAFGIVLSYCAKRRDKIDDQHPEEWRTLHEPRTVDPSEFESLPAWASKNPHGGYDIDCGSRSFPAFNGSRWIFTVIRRSFARGTENDFFAAVNAYRAYEAENLRLYDKFVGQRLAVNQDDDTGDAEEGSIRANGKRAWRRAMVAWCVQRGLSYRTLRAMRYRLRQLIASWPELFEKVDFLAEREIDQSALLRSILFGKVHQIARAVRGENRVFKGEMGEFKLDSASSCSPRADVILVGTVRRGLALEEDQANTRQVSDIAAEIDPRWLLGLYGRLCDFKMVDVEGDDPHREVVVSLFGIELYRDRMAPADRPREAVAM